MKVSLYLITILILLFAACQKKKSTPPAITPTVDSPKRATQPTQKITYPNVAKYTGILSLTYNVYLPNTDPGGTSP